LFFAVMSPQAMIVPAVSPFVRRDVNVDRVAIVGSALKSTDGEWLPLRGREVGSRGGEG